MREFRGTGVLLSFVGILRYATYSRVSLTLDVINVRQVVILLSDFTSLP